MDGWLTTLSASGLADRASRSISPSPARQVVGGKWAVAASNSTSPPSTSAGLLAPGARAPAPSPPQDPSHPDRALLPQKGAAMSLPAVPPSHSAAGQEAALVELLTEGRNRMRSAEGCQSFDVFRDEAEGQSFMFLQQWSSHEAHDAAFAELILQSGHLEKVIAALDEPIVQNIYEVVP